MDNATPFPIAQSERQRRISLCRALGRPFSEATVAIWIKRGRAYLAGASDIQRLNASWDIALADEDVELLGLLLKQAEAIFAGGFYDVEAVQASHRAADEEQGQILTHTFDEILDLASDG
jgi:hypothetical protein